MSEPKSLAAAYDTDRLPNGRFHKGNKLSKGWNDTVARKLYELRGMWYDANSVEDMTKVKGELIKLCTDCPVPDVKLRAIVYYMDRMLGKPTENVNLDVSGETKSSPLVNLNLSADELSAITKVIRRHDSGETEPEVIER